MALTSAFGTKRTSNRRLPMSAFGGKPDIAVNFALSRSVKTPDGGPSRIWTTKGEDELHPRLVRGRSLETDTTCQYCMLGQPSLFCYEHDGG
jgi:hypothetical protein